MPHLIAPPDASPSASPPAAIAAAATTASPQVSAQPEIAIAPAAVSFTATEPPPLAEVLPTALVTQAALAPDSASTPQGPQSPSAPTYSPSESPSTLPAAVPAVAISPDAAAPFPAPQESNLASTQPQSTTQSLTPAPVSPAITAGATVETPFPSVHFSLGSSSALNSTLVESVKAEHSQSVDDRSRGERNAALDTTACTPSATCENQTAPPQPCNLESCATPNPLNTAAPTTSANEGVRVDGISVQGSSVFDQATLAATLQPFTGRALSPTEQEAAADAITQLYLDQGYITSRAILTNPAVQNGVLQIQVIEGEIEHIDILGLEHLREDYVRSRIELATGRPLNSARLEEQLRLLRENPLFNNVEASLRSGSSQGKSLLTVRVDEASPWEASVGIDNHSPSVVGSEQFNLAAAYQNLTGNGDRLGASLQRTFSGGATTFSLGYSIPVNPMEGTLQLQGTLERNSVPVTPTLRVDGRSEEYSIRFRQPLHRTLAEEFALSLAFDYRDGQTFLGNIPFGFGFGPDPATGISRTSVVRFGQDYVKRDTQGAWALRSQFSLGLPILGATVNPAPIPDSQFFSWLGQAQRVQRLNDNHLLIMQADLQLSPSSLLPSEQFALGGWGSVRGYRQNIRAGDNGLRLSVEDRITLQRSEAGLSTLQLAPFAEVGTVWNSGGNPNPLPAQNLLAGLGLGILWQPEPKLNLRMDLALPLINVPNQGNALQRQGIYFQIGYRI